MLFTGLVIFPSNISLVMFITLKLIQGRLNEDRAKGGNADGKGNFGL